jgi:hypothetical protein
MNIDISVILPLSLVGYLLIIDFVDLYPLNDISQRKKHDRIAELFNYFIFIVGALCAMSDISPFIYCAFGIATVGLLGHITAWWIPYFFGHYSKFTKEEYDFAFSRTIKILPPIKDHPIPDLEHLPVGIILVWWFIVMVQKIA